MFVELLLFSVGAFMTVFSLFSMGITYIRVVKNRQELLETIENGRHQDDIRQWVCFHQRFSFGVNPETLENREALRIFRHELPEYSIVSNLAECLEPPPPDYETAIKMSD